MCVPPCEAGVNPMPPMPASRPLCMSTSPTSTNTSRTCTTARRLTIALQRSQEPLSRSPADLDDRFDQLRRDPVLRDVAGGAGLSRPVDVVAGVRAGQHQDADLGVPLADLAR